MHSHNEISNISFTLEKGSALFTLNVQIEYQGKEPTCIKFHTEKSSTDDKHYNNYLKNVAATGGCTDIQPINGVYQKNLIKSIFKKGVEDDIRNQLKYLNSHQEEKNYTKVFVLDVKDSKCKYESLEDIENADKTVMDFFQKKEPTDQSARKNVHKLIKENDVNYFFREGKLKNRLVNEVFSQEQRDYFQHTDQGKELLCQICELLLNAFKLGYSIHTSTNHLGANKQYTFEPDQFLALIGQEKTLEAKQEIKLSPSLYTLYSAHYSTMYGEKGSYYTTLKNYQAAPLTHNKDDYYNSLEAGFEKQGKDDKSPKDTQKSLTHEFDPDTGTTGIGFRPFK